MRFKDLYVVNALWSRSTVLEVRYVYNCHIIKSEKIMCIDLLYKLEALPHKVSAFGGNIVYIEKE